MDQGTLVHHLSKRRRFNLRTVILNDQKDVVSVIDGPESSSPSNQIRKTHR